MASPVSNPAASVALAPATRIRAAARARLLASGYSALTMDELAHELGMSKKTLYCHFRSKDELIDAIIEEIGQAIRDRMDSALANPKLDFTQKLCALVDIVGSNLALASPGLLHDLQRFAPQLYQKIDDLRQRNVPYVFGRLIRAGLAEGKVRPEIDPAFAVEFWLQAIRGLVHPAVLERTELTPRQTLERALRLFFGGLLSPAGRRDYDKYLASREKPLPR
jgi:AcrR family transcriptional regulator